MSLGTYIRVWEWNGDTMMIERHHESEIDAAYTAWVDHQIDKVLRFLTLHGDEYVTRASQIDTWTVSTPLGRKRAYEIIAAEDEEDAANREAAGLKEGAKEPWEET